jgi:hypothetical protein
VEKLRQREIHCYVQTCIDSAHFLRGKWKSERQAHRDAATALDKFEHVSSGRVLHDYCQVLGGEKHLPKTQTCLEPMYRPLVAEPLLWYILPRMTRGAQATQIHPHNVFSPRQSVLALRRLLW